MTTFKVPKVFITKKKVSNSSVTTNASKKKRQKAPTAVTNAELPPPDEMFFFENENSAMIIQNVKSDPEKPSKKKKKKQVRGRKGKHKLVHRKPDAATIVKEKREKLLMKKISNPFGHHPEGPAPNGVSFGTAFEPTPPPRRR